MEPDDVSRLITDFVNRRVWAVVGTSADPRKYGHRVYKALREAGYRVYGINPNLQSLDGDHIFPSLEALPERPEVVDLVVPPSVSEQVVRECARLGLNRVWLQPGAESEAVLRYCREHGIAVVHHACAIVHKKRWPATAGRPGGVV